jgi:HPt (histidine-containing phosphotransfer) domain-containing protein
MPGPDGASAGAELPATAISMAVINELRAIEARGSKGLLRTVVAKFADTTPAVLADIRAKLAAGDTELLWRAAHGLKSSAGAVGAVHVSTRCAEIEQAARRIGAAAAAPLIERLEAEAAAAIGQLQAMVTDDATVR